MNIEYFSSDFSSLLSSQGILRQFTWPHTTQLNGIADRKNRLLVETTRTMLLHAKVHVHHWGDAIRIAYFLINRAPSSYINNEVIHSILFHKELSFHVAPHVFECTCFVQHLSPCLDMFVA